MSLPRIIVLAAAMMMLATPFQASAQALPDYTLNPGDQLQVSVWREETLSRNLVILPDGTIGFPLVGTVKLAGLTVAQAEKLLNDKLSATIRAPRTTVVVNSVAGNRVYIIGRIGAPGGYVLQADTTLPQLISLAGGFAEFAKENRIAVLRRTDGGTSRIGFDLGRLLKGELDERVADFSLQAGDVIVVP